MTNLSAPKANKFPPTSNLMLIKSKSQFDILTRDETVPYDEIKAFCNSRGSQRTTERSVDSEHGNMVSNTIFFFYSFFKSQFHQFGLVTLPKISQILACTTSQCALFSVRRLNPTRQPSTTWPSTGKRPTS